jgi:hypothetical protein
LFACSEVTELEAMKRFLGCGFFLATLLLVLEAEVHGFSPQPLVSSGIAIILDSLSAYSEACFLGR